MVLKFIWTNEIEEKKIMFIHTNLNNIILCKKGTFFAELAMSQRWSEIFCATGVWGGKPSGRVRVNFANIETLVLEKKWNV